MGTSDGFCISPVDLNSFFEEDGKIYGYQGLKVIYFISCSILAFKQSFIFSDGLVLMYCFISFYADNHLG